MYRENPNVADALPDKIAIIPVEGGGPLKTFDIRNSGTIPMMVRWSPDGRSLHYNETRNNITNIWSQPLDGGPAKQLTDFRDLLVSFFAWSPDGKQLAASRGLAIRDAVLISDLR
jgi:Tol biopolymer transport system component